MKKLLTWVPLSLVLYAGAGGGLEPTAGDVLGARSIPPRPLDAPAGSRFLARTAGMTEAERERAILAELGSGNVPDFLRRLRPVELRGPSADGPAATIWVMPDYLAVGSDRDFVRVPVNRHTAMAVARRFGFVLPTRKMVNAVYEQAALRLPPQPMQPGPEMRSSAYYLAHHRRIEAQRAGRSPSALVSGHKKDLVLTNRLAVRPQSVAIYGWHRFDGRPIQPLSTWHGARYADYSHGVRLVSETVLVGATPRSVYEVLEDPDLAELLSDEGAIRGARRLMGF